MKLLRIKLPDNLIEPFRSLRQGFEISFYPNLNNKNIEPIGFAGLNGSGKSNLLELISEVFYYLDSMHLEFPTAAVTDEKDFGFEIDYALPFSSDNPFIDYDDPIGFKLEESYFIVRASKAVKSRAAYQITSIGQYELQRQFESTRNVKDKKIQSIQGIWKSINSGDRNIAALLPKKIFAYTSGQNEQLSNCYLKMQFHYFNDYKNKIKAGSKFYFDSSRLFFCDNNASSSIFIANYLLANQNALKQLNKIIEVKELHSFRITIRYADLSGSEIKFNQDLERKIEALKSCATTLIEKGVGAKKILTLDYLVTGATKLAFQRQLTDSPFELYKTFYELEMQNFYTVPDEVLDMATDGPSWLVLSDELPKQNPNDLIFRIEKVFVKKNGIDKIIKYKGLSDGEHQFIQVVGMILMMEESGCLFLLDEPDTHYNPLWRSQLVNTINNVVKYKTTSKKRLLRLQEIVITTHSPFVISDLKQKNVYIFKKENNIVKFTQCHFQTYGASSSIILDEIFGKSDSISEMARQELKTLVGKVKSLSQLSEVASILNNQFGESVDKFEYYNQLRTIKESLERKTKSKIKKN